MPTYPEQYPKPMTEGPTLNRPEDSWRHRSLRMRCVTCMWFVIKPVDLGPAQSPDSGMLGRCRRHSPSISGYPAVFQNDWCGDHKLDENKV